MLDQHAELLRVNEDYRCDLETLRRKWGIPPQGFSSSEEGQAWQRDLLKAVDRRTEYYWALWEKACKRGRSDQLLSSLLERANRENPMNRLWRDVRALNRRYGLGEEFDRYLCLIWNSHVGVFATGGLSFAILDTALGDPIPKFGEHGWGIVITPFLTQRDILEAWPMVAGFQRKRFGRIPAGGRPKRGEDRSLVIGEKEGLHVIRITPHLSKRALKREWPRIKALQKRLWPNYRRRHHQPAHQRRMGLIRLGGLDSIPRYVPVDGPVEEESPLSRTMLLVADLWANEDGDDDRHAAAVRKDRERLRKKMKPRQ